VHLYRTETGKKYQSPGLGDLLLFCSWSCDRNPVFCAMQNWENWIGSNHGKCSEIVMKNPVQGIRPAAAPDFFLYGMNRSSPWTNLVMENSA
jgi:hypothetical protein